MKWKPLYIFFWSNSPYSEFIPRHSATFRKISMASSREDGSAVHRSTVAWTMSGTCAAGSPGSGEWAQTDDFFMTFMGKPGGFFCWFLMILIDFDGETHGFKISQFFRKPPDGFPMWKRIFPDVKMNCWHPDVTWGFICSYCDTTSTVLQMVISCPKE